MKCFKPFFLFVVVFMISATSLLAQPNYTEEADDAFSMKMYYEAIDLYKKAYSKTSNQVEKRRILFRIAESYRLSNQIRRAEFAYQRAIRSDYSDPIVHLRYGDILRMREDFEEAIEQYKKYKKEKPDDKRADVGIESAKLASDWIENPTRYKVESNRRFNDREGDFAPAYADRNYKTLVFTSTRKEATGKTDPNTGQSFSDLFLIEKDKRGNWSRAELLEEDEVINTGVNEGAATFTRRFNKMYFTRCPMEKGKVLTCKIYVSKKRGRSWSEPEQLDLGPDSFSYKHPAISSDERTLIFASDMKGGKGKYDLWKAERRSSSRPFGEAENLGSKINTKENEIYPTLRDDKTLYFASDGHPGLGGRDIFVTEKEDGEWSEPENMKYPINSQMDDFGITFNKNDRILSENKVEEMGFFSTNRRGGRGGDDVWRFWLPEIIFTISGEVRDEKTLQLLSDAKVTMNGSDGTSVTTKTDENGQYKFNKNQVNKNTSYDLKVSKKGYLPSDEKKETTVGRKSSTDLVLDFKIEPIPDEPVALPEIRFELDSSNLQEQYKDSLNGLINTMKNKPQLVVELGTHTDYRADEEYNDTLSLERAKSIVDYLVSEGLDKERLKPKGYGERMPRTLEEDMTVDGYTFEEGTTLSENYIKGLRSKDKREAAHQLNRRSTFKVLRTDYVPDKDKVDDVDTTGFAGIELNPDENKVNLLVEENTYIIPVIANGVLLKATYQQNSDGIYLSYDKAMNFLTNARITKDNFEKGVDAIKDDGTIVDNSKLKMDNVSIGNKEMEDVEMVVIKDQEQDLVIGKQGIEKFGEFTINQEEDELVFDRTAFNSQEQEEENQ